MSFRDPILKPIYDRVWIVCNLAEFPALTILPFLRRGIGYRTLCPWRMALMAILLFLIGCPLVPGAFTRAPDGSGAQGYLGLFVIAMTILAKRQRVARKREFLRGVKQHSYSRGTSVFSFLGASQSTLRDFVDPVATMALGFLIHAVLSSPLGIWLMISGFALRLHEGVIHQYQSDQEMDMIDAAVNSENVGEMMAQYEPPPETQQTTAPEAPLPTSLSPDLQDLMARRKKRGVPPPLP